MEPPKNIIEAFDRVDQKDIYVEHAGQRQIPPEVWDDYISQITDAKLKETVIKVREKTVYLEWDRFIKMLNIAFQNFKDYIKEQPFLIYLPENKFGSEYVFVALLWKEIKNLNFAGIISLNNISLLKEGSNVLIIDDVAYSGNNLIGSLDELNFHSQIKFNYHVVIACTTNTNFLSEALPHLKGRLFTANLIPRVEVADKIHSKYDYEMAPVYCDHKVAGVMSSFPLIYLDGILGVDNEGKKFGSLLPYPPDTKVKDRLYDKYFKQLGTLEPPKETRHDKGMESF
jgi:hypothetical protein